MCIYEYMQVYTKYIETTMIFKYMLRISTYVIVYKYIIQYRSICEVYISE